MRTLVLLPVLAMTLLPATPAVANNNLVGRIYPGPWANIEPNPPECPTNNIVGRWSGGGYACFDPNDPTPQTHEIPEDQIDDLGNQGIEFEPTDNLVGRWFNPVP